MYSGGFIGKVLRVDLTQRTTTAEDLPGEWVRDYIGGAGLGIKYLYDEVAAGVDPLGPDNKLIFMNGPFTGTDTPCASRLAVVSKSPLTGAVAMALTGGFFPAELKFAGWDAIIIEGKANAPVYLSIKDDKVQIRDASNLWGLDTPDTQWTLKDDLNDQNVRIACIGPAGERLNKIACIINERRAAGRKGVGAVMGSKNLKAIAVRGTNPVPIADPAKYKVALKFFRDAMKASPQLYPHFSKTGTPAVAEITTAMGVCSAKNYTGTGTFQLGDLGMESQDAHNVGKNPCYKCPVGCSQMKLARGQYEGILAEGPEFESLYAVGTACGNFNLDAVIAADRLCDDVGVDVMSAGITIGFAMELYEKGILTKDMCDGIELTWGNHEAMLEVLRRLAHRRPGIGELLADGVQVAAEKIGNGAEHYAITIKGMELPAYDVRGLKAHGLSYATSYTGADHNRGYAFQEVFGIPVPYEVDRLAYEGKGKLARWNQDVRTATCDNAPMCAFVLDMAVPDVALRNTAQLMEATTGMPYTEDDVYAAGERTQNVAKAFNMREGFTRADDKLPRRLMEEGIPDGPSKGEMVPQDKLDLMLDEYYDARGWDENGVPTAAKLESLGLSDIAKDLGIA